MWEIPNLIKQMCEKHISNKKRKSRKTKKTLPRKIQEESKLLLKDSKREKLSQENSSREKILLYKQEK